MCRLFGLHAGTEPAPATFWLLGAEDSLAQQSHREPDGAGIGTFDGTPPGPVVTKQPIAAWHDREFAAAAREATSTTFVAHVRFASTGSLQHANTHPFIQDGRIFAHNGAFYGLDRLDERLERLAAADLVAGDTDSERLFALITAEIRSTGDETAGIVSALSWAGRNLPVLSLNLVMTTATDLWAVRYPSTNPLYVLNRSRPELMHVSSSRIGARGDAMPNSVVIATEPMDDDPGWRLLGAGEMLHVTKNLDVKSTSPFDRPVHQLTLDDLSDEAAAAQRG